MIRSFPRTAALILALAFAAPSQAQQPESVEPEPLTTVERSQLRERAVTQLLELADDPSASIRANAIEGLAPAPARLRAVLPVAFKDENAGVRAVAAMTAGRLRLCDLAPQLRPLRSDASEFVRLAAIFALARCADEKQLDTIAENLLTSPSSRMRAHAAYLLGELRDPTAAPLLLDAADEPLPAATDAEARIFQIQIAEALYKLGERDQTHSLYTALYTFDANELEATVIAAQIIGEIGLREATANLNNLLAFRDQTGRELPPEVRLVAARSLLQLGARGTPPYATVGREHARDEDPTLRALAAHVLGESRDPLDLARLRDLLDDADPTVRVAAAAGVLRATR